MLSQAERRVLRVFREYLMAPGQMLCFYGTNLEKYRPALHDLTKMGLLVKEDFKGGYSLTPAGSAAMKAYGARAKKVRKLADLAERSG